MDEVKVLIMRPRERVFAHAERLVQEPIPVGLGEMPAARPQAGGVLRRAFGAFEPVAPQPTTLRAYVTDRVEPERMTVVVADGNTMITTVLGFREIPGGTSVTATTEARVEGNALQELAVRAINRTMASRAARSLLEHIKRQIDDLPPGS